MSTQHKSTPASPIGPRDARPAGSVAAACCPLRPKKDPGPCPARGPVLPKGECELRSAAAAELHTDIAAWRWPALDEQQHAVTSGFAGFRHRRRRLLRRDQRLLVDRKDDVAAMQALLCGIV